MTHTLDFIKHSVFSTGMLLLIACSRETRIPDDVKPYVASFQTEAAARNHPVGVDNLQIGFDDLHGKEAAGECSIDDLGNPTITLDKAWWNGPEGIETTLFELNALREVILYHELGHCLLGQGHRPNSIMDPMANPLPMELDRKSLLDEMFNFQAALKKPVRSSNPVSI